MSEIPDNDPGLTHADVRRAAAYLLHHLRRDVDGVVAVLDEAYDVERVPYLTMAMAYLFEKSFPELRTAKGAELIVENLAELAVAEGEQS